MKSAGQNQTLTYFLLSMAFIAFNLITLSNLPPWIDEVMILDTSYNAAVHGSWETTAWYRVVGQHPFSTYPPLYQMLATVWIWLFGSRLTTVRSMNLLFTFLLGVVCLRLIKHRGQKLTAWTVTLFTLLLWGTSEMAWMYRNGRPDMLCALLFVFTTVAIERYRQEKSTTTRLAVIFASALLLCSGVQAAVCLCFLWLFFFLAMKGQRRETGRLLVLIVPGLSLGVLMVSLFMLAHGRFMAFASSIVQYSATLSDIALAVLPWLGKAFGFSATLYTQKLQELNMESNLCDRLTTIIAYRSFVVLSVAALVAYASCFRNSLKELMNDHGFLLLLSALYMPLVMTLAGRYPDYYRWMTFLPLIVSITYIAARNSWWCSVFTMLAVLLSVVGIKSMLPEAHSCASTHPFWLSGDYENLRSFVQRQHLKASDAVVCPFSLFYEIKPVCDTCYFIGIFPTEFMGHIDYIIEASDGDAFNQPITNYVNKLKSNPSIELNAIDSCEHPSLTLYQVHPKHE